jgi:hypothetical protein
MEFRSWFVVRGGGGGGGRRLLCTYTTVLYIWTKRNFVLRDDFSLRRAFSKSEKNSLCNRASFALLHSPIRVL